MRILVSIQPLHDIKYNNEYHYDIQGFIYNILRDTNYHYIHDKKGNKFFCFSNIFPYNSILKKNRYYFLIISSPDSELIESIHKHLSKYIRKSIFFGNMRFNIISLKIFSLDILSSKTFKLKTETPIIIRIPAELIESEKNYDYYFWKKEFSIGLFISQVEKNLYKKYNEFLRYKKLENISSDSSEYYNINSTTLFEKFLFKKQISNKINIKKTQHIIIGSLWEFYFEGWYNRNLIQFALDTGLGERNSLGFGFINIIYND